MNSLRVGIFAFLGGVALFIQSSRADGIQFSHKDWELVCDNTRTCRAAGYQADGRDERLVSMLLTREAGPNTPVFMELQLDDEEKTAVVRAQVGDLVIPSLAIGKVPQKEAAKLLAVMPDEEELILTAGDQQWKLSLAGLKAILLAMDDEQGRIGTPGALIKKGDKSEQQVLPPIPVRTLIVPQLPPTKKQNKAVMVALDDFLDSKCEWDEDACRQNRSVKRLSEDKLMVSQLSYRGASSEAYSVFIVNDKLPYNPKPATDAEDGLLYDTDGAADGFGDKNKVILYVSELHKGVMSDGRWCWSWCWMSWAWTGSKFEKAEESTSWMCNAAWDLPTFVSNVVNKNDKVKK